MAGMVPDRLTERLMLVPAVSATPLTLSSFILSASGPRMAVSRAAIALRRVGSSVGNEHVRAFQAAPLPPGRFPSEGGSRITGVVGMAAILPQVVERAFSQPWIAATEQ